MFLRTESIPIKKLIGLSTQMSLADNKTFELWHHFMRRRKEITNATEKFLYSMQVYNENYNPADMNEIFEKRAVVAVSHFENTPSGMQTFVLPAGDYAVFLHRGTATEAPKTFQYIFGVWLPNSNYLIDSRPHFEILDEKYKNGDPNSEEEIWIPIRVK